MQKLTADADLDKSLCERASAALEQVDVLALDAALRKKKPAAKPKRRAKPKPKRSKAPSAVQGRGYNFLLIVGEAGGETPAYQRALAGMGQDIASAGDGRLSGEAHVKTFTGDSLPEPGSTAGIEGYVRMMQMRLGMGLLAFEVEFRQHDGFRFMVVYMRQ